MVRWHWVLFVAAASACKGKQPSAAREAAPSSPSSRATPSSRPSPSASAAPSSSARSASGPPRAASSARALYIDNTPELAKKYRAALGRARKLQAEGAVDEAAEAFIEASGKGQDVYYRAIAELGYLDLVKLGNSSEETEFELLVATRSSESDVRAQAWFNLATLYRQRGESEASRAALARSLSLRDTAAARTQLGQRSNCVAELGPRGHYLTPSVVDGWVGVCTALSRCTEGDKLSDAEARNLSCISVTEAGAAEPEAVHGCKDAPPWEASFGYSWFTWTQAWFTPAGKNRFMVLRSGAGGWQAICRGFQDFKVEQSKDYVLVRGEDTPSMVARGRSTPQNDIENGLCWDQPQSHTFAVFALKSAKLLAAARVVDGHEVDVQLDAAAGKLRLTGGGCDGVMALDGSQRLTR